MACVIATTSGACCDAMQGTALAAMQGTGRMRVATYNIGAKTVAGKPVEFRDKLKKDFLQLQASNNTSLHY
eukprot:147576-Heterocapsa_arctica.AAC.1